MRGSLKNQVTSNRIDGFPSAVLLGSNTGVSSGVEGNLVSANWLTNSGTGIFLNTGTQSNIIERNNFVGTIRPIIDLGVRN